MGLPELREWVQPWQEEGSSNYGSSFWKQKKMSPVQMGKRLQEAQGEKTIQLKGKLPIHAAQRGHGLEGPSVKDLQIQEELEVASV